MLFFLTFFLPFIAHLWHAISTLAFCPLYLFFWTLSGDIHPLDELYAQKLKYKAISEELDHALNDMTSLWEAAGCCPLS